MRPSQESVDLTGIFDQLPNPILIHSDGKVVFANDLVLAVTGYSREGILGRNVASLLTDPADAKNTALYRALAGRDLPEEKEFEIRTENRKVVIRNFLVRNSRIRFRGKRAVMTVLVDITERKHLEKYVLGRVLETEEKDRKQFATDLHDDLGPILSSIKLHLGLLEHARTPEKFSETLAICNEQLTEAIAKMRIIANNLNPRLLENFGLEAAIQAFIGNVQQEGVFDVHFRSNLGNGRLARPVELHLYRIVCELVNNTIKHAGATEARVRLVQDKGWLRLSYTDNGKGYDVKTVHRRQGGMGVGNIIQRVKLMDAEIRFLNRKGKTEVHIRKEI
ncbi:MAG TPA: PAS domain S-box protein [Bacteroidales bacterium]|nr:PAS domain S-box protein [Bacteroidales bacterium]